MSLRLTGRAHKCQRHRLARVADLWQQRRRQVSDGDELLRRDRHDRCVGHPVTGYEISHVMTLWDIGPVSDAEAAVVGSRGGAR